jgi:AhpD family alkylhydroperoxidase
MSIVYKGGKETTQMNLDRRTMRLIAVGASITANCQPCLQTNTTQALQEGVSQEEIAEAIEIGRRVRKGAASKMDKFAASLNHTVPVDAGSTDAGCGCTP